jgi:aldehyde:ferredoxin oxidoreductase
MSTRNYRSRQFEGAAALDGARMENARVRSRGCARCPVRCKAVLRFREGRYKDRDLFRPEFEPMINLGAKCGLDDAPTLVHLDNLLTRLGLDSTSAATTIAFAMDLFDRGMLPENLTGGLDLSWGNGNAMEILIHQMASGTGLGGILARGVRRAAAVIGGGAERYAAHVKGLELTAYHPAALLGSALGYAISSRGGDYNNVYAAMEHRWTPEQAARAFGTPKALDPGSYDGKGRLIHRAVLVNIIMDSLGICKVPALSMIGTFDLENEARLTSALTGWDVTAADLFAIGQRAADVERLINIRLGLTPGDDDLPEMFFSGGRPGLDRLKFKRMIDEFYAAMGWDADGRPADQADDDLPSL